jgi:hypothetical protein
MKCFGTLWKAQLSYLATASMGVAHSFGTTKKKTNYVACSPQANYTDRVAAAC